MAFSNECSAAQRTQVWRILSSGVAIVTDKCLKYNLYSPAKKTLSAIVRVNPSQCPFRHGRRKSNKRPVRLNDHFPGCSQSQQAHILFRNHAKLMKKNARTNRTEVKDRKVTVRSIRSECAWTKIKMVVATQWCPKVARVAAVEAHLALWMLSLTTCAR